VNPLAVGLVGAGPWAESVHAPMLAAGPETRLAGVWARRPEAARALAARHGVEPADSFAALLERSEALAFAVPPDVQVELAVAAARAGKHLLLEKPLALTLDGAREITRAVDDAGVMSRMMLSYRDRPGIRAFLAAARDFEAVGAQLSFLSSAALGGRYATPWRIEHGALLDLGPHVLDLLEAALGSIEEIAGRGNPRRWMSLTCVHSGGAVSQSALSITMPLSPSIFRFELHGPRGVLALDARATGETPWAEVVASFVAAVRAGRPHALDVHRGLRLQELMDQALLSASA
jgi:predicted dehydrogenase